MESEEKKTHYKNVICFDCFLIVKLALMVNLKTGSLKSLDMTHHLSDLVQAFYKKWQC
jgi:hypothetical protein